MVRSGTPGNTAHGNLSVLHIAVYEAMVAAWDSKDAHSRPHPSKPDTQLRTAIPNPPSPSWPSEHAVAASGAATVRGYLFRADAEALTAPRVTAAVSRICASIRFAES